MLCIRYGNSLLLEYCACLFHKKMSSKIIPLYSEVTYYYVKPLTSLRKIERFESEFGLLCFWYIYIFHKTCPILRFDCQKFTLPVKGAMIVTWGCSTWSGQCWPEQGQRRACNSVQQSAQGMWHISLITTSLGVLMSKENVQEQVINVQEEANPCWIWRWSDTQLCLFLLFVSDDCSSLFRKVNDEVAYLNPLRLTRYL